MAETYQLLGVDSKDIVTLEKYLQDYFTNILKKLKDLKAQSKQTDIYFWTWTLLPLCIHLYMLWFTKEFLIKYEAEGSSLTQNFPSLFWAWSHIDDANDNQDINKQREDDDSICCGWCLGLLLLERKINHKCLPRIALVGRANMFFNLYSVLAIQFQETDCYEFSCVINNILRYRTPLPAARGRHRQHAHAWPLRRSHRFVGLGNS